MALLLAECRPLDRIVWTGQWHRVLPEPEPGFARACRAASAEQTSRVPRRPRPPPAPARNCRLETGFLTPGSTSPLVGA